MRAYRTPTESSLCAKMGDSNNNNNHDVSYLYWILIVGPVCRIVPLLQEAFLEQADLTVSFSHLLAQHPIAVKPCIFFLQNIFWEDGKLHGSAARMHLSEPQFPNLSVKEVIEFRREAWRNAVPSLGWILTPWEPSGVALIAGCLCYCFPTEQCALGSYA